MLAICWLVFFFDLVTARGANLGPIAVLGVIYAPAIQHGQWWRLFTYGFIHFGWAHIFFNSYALFQVGWLVEYIYGSARYALIYIGALLGGGVAAYYSTIHTQIPTAGASGAIMGVFGAMAVLGLKIAPLRGTLLRNALLPIALTLGYGFTNPGISNAGHIGGVITGAALAFALRPARAGELMSRLAPSAPEEIQ